MGQNLRDFGVACRRGGQLEHGRSLGPSSPGPTDCRLLRSHAPPRSLSRFRFSSPLLRHHPASPEDVPVWIKICGIRDASALQAAVAAGATAIGFNFVPTSSRVVARGVARSLVAELPPTVTPVGLFCNQPVEFVLSTAHDCGLQMVQLHGDESISDAVRVAREYPLLRSLNWSPAGLAPLGPCLAEFSASGVTPWGILIDGPRVGQQTGGTGHRVDWQQLARDWPKSETPRLILAGGLNPGNVAEAVEMVQPAGVDVASGVESTPGVKDPRLMRQFCEAARAGTTVRT